MEEALNTGGLSSEQDQRITETLAKEHARLRGFIRKHVLDDDDAEEIFQDVFYEFVEAYRLMKPIEQAGAWLFRVARNRITDLFRRRRSAHLTESSRQIQSAALQDRWEDLLPSPEAGPDAVFARKLLIRELTAALEELPAEQREAFIETEVEGKTFQELSDSTGVGVNTLLSRKRYAVLRLRRRLQAIHEDFGTE